MRGEHTRLDDSPRVGGHGDAEAAGAAGGGHNGGRLGAAALSAATAGHYVFPVHPRSKIPAVGDWERTATRDPEQITLWWAARPYNIGLSTGRSGLLVVDLDLAHGHEPPPEWAGARGGFDVLVRLAAAAGALFAAGYPHDATVLWTSHGSPGRCCPASWSHFCFLPG